MKKNWLLFISSFICGVICFGFVTGAALFLRSGERILKQDAENVSSLALRGISDRIDTLFKNPVNAAMAIANEGQLLSLLSEEGRQKGRPEKEEHRKEPVMIWPGVKQPLDEKFIRTVQECLVGYEEQYGFISVSLISAKTGYCYLSGGTAGDPVPDAVESGGYAFLSEQAKPYSLMIDCGGDNGDNNEITAYVVYRIGTIQDAALGAVCVGFKADSLKEVFTEYEGVSGARAYLTDRDGTVLFSADRSEIQQDIMLLGKGFRGQRKRILSKEDQRQALWYAKGGQKGCVVARYIPGPGWHLVINKDTSALERQIFARFLVLGAVAVLEAVLAATAFALTIRRYKAYLADLRSCLPNRRA